MLSFRKPTLTQRILHLLQKYFRVVVPYGMDRNLQESRLSVGQVIRALCRRTFVESYRQHVHWLYAYVRKIKVWFADTAFITETDRDSDTDGDGDGDGE